MTVDEFFSSYCFHDCDIIDMRLCGNELTISFDMFAEYNVDKDVDYRDTQFYLKAKFINVSDLTAKKLSTINTKCKKSKGQNDYTEEECSLKEAWVSLKQNFLNYIEQYCGNGIMLGITAGNFVDDFIITFNCEDVLVVETKLITDEELATIKKQIENDDTPKIVLRNK
jgi:hypothetical protein